MSYSWIGSLLVPMCVYAFEDSLEIDLIIIFGCLYGCFSVPYHCIYHLDQDLFGARWGDKEGLLRPGAWRSQ